VPCPRRELLILGEYDPPAYVAPREESGSRPLQPLGRLQAEGILPEELDVAPLATGFVAAVQGGYLLAQTARDVTPMAFAVDMAIAHLRLLVEARDPAHP